MRHPDKIKIFGRKRWIIPIFLENRTGGQADPDGSRGAVSPCLFLDNRTVGQVDPDGSRGAASSCLSPGKGIARSRGGWDKTRLLGGGAVGLPTFRGMIQRRTGGGSLPASAKFLRVRCP